MTYQSVYSPDEIRTNGSVRPTTARLPVRQDVEVRGLNLIAPTRVEWLWPGRIPLGKVTIFDGDPGLGKSTVLLDFAARGSVGGRAPTGEPLPQFATIIASSEDDPSDTIRPRFDLAGGNPKRIYICNRISFPEQAYILDEAIDKTGARFAFVDPLVEFLDDSVKTISDHAVRRAMQPLVEIAQRRHVAIVGVRHLNKSSGGPAIYRGGGSIGFGGLARSVLTVGRDPEDEERFVLASVKINVARRPPSLAYRLVADGPYEPARVEWLGESEHSAETLIGADRDREVDKSKTDKLADAMREVVTANGGDMLARDLYSALESDGWDLRSEDLKSRARRRAGITMVQPSGLGQPWRATLQ